MKKTKKVHISVTFIIIALLMIITFLLFYKPNSQTYYFEDENYGTMKFRITGKTGIWKYLDFLQNAVTFVDTNVNVGDSIYLTDSHIVGTLSSTECGIANIEIEVAELTDPGIDSIILDFTMDDAAFPAGSLIEVEGWITPSEPGEYGAITTYFEKECDPFMMNCVESATCAGWFEDDSINTVVVNSVSCTNDCPCDPWVLHDSISNGHVNERDCYTLDTNDCSCDYDDTEYRTICNSGYVITGTTETWQPGQHTCELAATGDCNTDGCTDPQVCNTDTGLCQDAECSADLTRECINGTTIIEKECVGGFLQDTGNTCPEDNEETPDVTTPTESSWLLIGTVIVGSIITLIVIYFIIRKFK